MEAQEYKKLVEALRSHLLSVPLSLLNDAADAIEALQDTVQSQDKALKECAEQLANSTPKRGEWIVMGDFEQCSVCHGTHLKEFKSYYGKVTWVKSDFCGNCGADMRKMEEADACRPD